MTHFSKIQMAREVVLAFIFLGIPTEKFSELKNQYGSLVALHAVVAKMLGA